MLKVTTADGFTIEENPRGGLNYLLHGERWPAEGEQFEPVILIESLAREIDRLNSIISKKENDNA